jgi:hypothetical protein
VNNSLWFAVMVLSWCAVVLTICTLGWLSPIRSPTFGADVDSLGLAAGN